MSTIAVCFPAEKRCGNRLLFFLSCVIIEINLILWRKLWNNE